MKKVADSRFKTHIPEPRWQQVISVVLLLIVIGVFTILVIFADKT